MFLCDDPAGGIWGKPDSGLGYDFLSDGRLKVKMISSKPIELSQKKPGSRLTHFTG